MKTKTNQIFTFVHVVFWIIFVGLCIKAGALLTTSGISLFLHAQAAQDLYMGLNLNPLYEFSIWHYAGFVSVLIAVACLKAYIAYLVLLIFKRLDLNNPFQKVITKLISDISYVALGTGMLAIMAEGYGKWLVKRGVALPQLDWSGGEFLFLAGVIFIIALVFQKGVELQTETELTI